MLDDAVGMDIGYGCLLYGKEITDKYSIRGIR